MADPKSKSPEAVSETPKTPEKKPEAAPKTPEKKPEVAKAAEPKKEVSKEAAKPKEKPSGAKPQPVAPAKPKKDETLVEIEEVLSEDLEDLYKNLPADKKQEFKDEGEKTAGLIREMIEKGKVHGRKVLKLIRAWLRMIPGVNKFFLEQESKIKMDKILDIAKEDKESEKKDV